MFKQSVDNYSIIGKIYIETTSKQSCMDIFAFTGAEPTAVVLIPFQMNGTVIGLMACLNESFANTTFDPWSIRLNTYFYPVIRLIHR